MSNQAHTSQPVIDVLGLPKRLGEFRDLLAQFAYAKMPLGELQLLVRRQYFMAAVEHENYNYCAAAKLMGVHRSTVDRVLGRKWKLKREVSTNGRAVQPPNAADGAGVD